MSAPTIRVPPLIYGTAWKKDQSRLLVKQALLAGFRGVDTAAQPKHYQEDLVGQGIRDALKEGGLTREELYVSVKGDFKDVIRIGPKEMRLRSVSRRSLISSRTCFSG